MFRVHMVKVSVGPFLKHRFTDSVIASKWCGHRDILSDELNYITGDLVETPHINNGVGTGAMWYKCTNTSIQANFLMYMKITINIRYVQRKLSLKIRILFRSNIKQIQRYI